VVSSNRAAIGQKEMSGLKSLPEKLRAAEKFVFGFMALALAAAVLLRLPFGDCVKVFGLNLLVGFIVLLLSLRENQQQNIFLSDLRDWFPCVLIPLAYRESGLFFTPDPSHRLDNIFIDWDRALLQNPWVAHGLSVSSPYLEPVLEFAYLLCYPLVPLALLSIVLARKRGSLKSDHESRADRTIDRFWTAVLLAVFTCYVVYPFFPLTPPRVLFPDLGGPLPVSALRHMNLWLLHQNGDQVSLFPSGHVAAIIAASLAVRGVLLRLGWVFVFAAGLVTVATVVGRYHYAADAAAGALVGLTAYIIARRLCPA
jgi:membrane-associated phospholipid phosphatase